MGLGSHRPRRREPCTGEEEEAAAAKGLHFVRFCPWALVGLGRTDGEGSAKERRGEGERERERTKLSTPDKNVERKERRLASNTNTTSVSEGGVEEGG